MAAKKPAQPFDMDRIVQIADKLNQIRDALNNIFPERVDLVNQLIFALLTREHVLIYGIYGTGKTDIADTLFNCITGARIFKLGMTRGTQESAFVGLPNPKKMRELGVIEYARETGMLDDDFAELDELLDSTPEVLRSLLSIMNERIFKRGRQVERANLMTAVASTNGEPSEEVKRNRTLGAVIDRFLFKSRVEYLAEAESRRRMYGNYLQGATPGVAISLDDVKYISEMVVSACQISDPHFIEVYDQVIQAYRQKLVAEQLAPLSDRTACKLLQLVEANAALNGRYEVVYEDILAIRWALCMGGNQHEHEMFMEVASPIVATAQANVVQQIDEAEKQLLAKYEAELTGVSPSLDETAMVHLKRNLVTQSQEVAAIKPKLDSTRDQQKRLLAEINRRIAQVQDLIDGRV